MGNQQIPLPRRENLQGVSDHMGTGDFGRQQINADGIVSMPDERIPNAPAVLASNQNIH